MHPNGSVSSQLVPLNQCETVTLLPGALVRQRVLSVPAARRRLDGAAATARPGSQLIYLEPKVGHIDQALLGDVQVPAGILMGKFILTHAKPVGEGTSGTVLRGWMAGRQVALKLQYGFPARTSLQNCTMLRNSLQNCNTLCMYEKCPGLNHGMCRNAYSRYPHTFINSTTFWFCLDVPLQRLPQDLVASASRCQSRRLVRLLHRHVPC